MSKLPQYAPGLGLALGIALIALGLGSLWPLVGGPVFGIVLGIAVGSTAGRPARAVPGLQFAAKQLLQWAIVLLGAGLSLTQVYRVGRESLWVMAFTLSGAFITAYGLGRLLGTPFKLTSLIGMGTAICGGSAIAAIAPIIEAEDQEIAYAIGTVFLFNIAAVLIFPPLGHWLHFSDRAFGLWAGTAINDTSSVVASGYAFSDAAGSYATIVKLTRSTMIIPISLVFAVLTALQKRSAAAGGGGAVDYRLGRIFPWFILWFLVAALLHTAGIISGRAGSLLTEGGKFLIIVALAAIGLNTDLRRMRAMGLKPVLLGLGVWFAVTVISLAVQFAGGLI
jgi:uncharacterized integral membrane protein (TIGR00698 family)